MEDCMLTTYDNSFNPFTNFEAWWKEDRRLGYDTCGLLARTSNVSDIISDELYDKEVRFAMEELVSRFPTIFKIVYKSDYQEAS